MIYAARNLTGWVGLIKRHVGLVAKLGLWSLRVMRSSRLAVLYIRSSRSIVLAIFLASRSIERVVPGQTFLYVLFMFFCNSPSYAVESML